MWASGLRPALPHSDEDAGGPVTIAEMGSLRRGRPPTGRAERPRKLCIDFFRAGCHFGSSCKFAHSVDAIPRGSHPPSPAVGGGGGDMVNVAPRECLGVSKRRLCIDHFNGRCHFGDRCKFAHSVEDITRNQRKSWPPATSGGGPLPTQALAPAPAADLAWQWPQVPIGAAGPRLEAAAWATQQQLDALSSMEPCYIGGSHAGDALMVCARGDCLVPQWLGPEVVPASRADADVVVRRTRPGQP